MNYREFYKRKNSFSPFNLQGDYYESYSRSLPKEAFLQNKQQTNYIDPYEQEVFNLKPYLKEKYYDCRVPKADVVSDNPVDRYTAGFNDTLNGQAILEKDYGNRKVETRLSIYHLINLYRHSVRFEFLKEEELIDFYKTLCEFIEYNEKLKQSRNYLNISPSSVSSIEDLIRLLENNFDYILKPKEDIVNRFAGYNPLMAMNYQKQLEAMNPEKPNVKSYNINNYQVNTNNVRSYKINYTDTPKVQRVKEEFATPNLFHDKISKKVKF